MAACLWVQGQGKILCLRPVHMKAGGGLAASANQQQEAELREDYALCSMELLATNSLHELQQLLAGGVAFLCHIAALQVPPVIEEPFDFGDPVCSKRSAKQQAVPSAAH